MKTGKKKNPISMEIRINRNSCTAKQPNKYLLLFIMNLIPIYYYANDFDTYNNHKS